MTVVNNCTNCHSVKLVAQNRMNAERWNASIKWMQQTQNLWNFGDNQEIIVNYLVTNYPSIAKWQTFELQKHRLVCIGRLVFCSFYWFHPLVRKRW
jgi:hypothetical protein